MDGFAPTVTPASGTSDLGARPAAAAPGAGPGSPRFESRPLRPYELDRGEGG